MKFSLAEEPRDAAPAASHSASRSGRDDAGPGSSPAPARGARPRPPVWLALALVVAAVSAVGAGASFYLAGEQRRADAAYLALVDAQEALARTAVAAAPRAAAGSRAAFESLRAVRAEGDALVARLRAGGREVEPLVTHLESEWSGITESIDSIAAAEEPVFAVREVLTGLEAVLDEMRGRSEGLLTALRAGEATPAQIHAATVQTVLVERAAQDVGRLLASGRPSASRTGVLGQNGTLQSLVGRILNGLLLGDPNIGVEQVDDDDATGRLEVLGRLHRRAADALREIIANTLVVVHVQETVDALAASGERVPEATRALRAAYRARAAGRPASDALGFLLGSVALSALLAAAVLLARQARRRDAEAARVRGELAHAGQELEITRSRHHHAMLAVLDRIEAFARGDLSRGERVADEASNTVLAALESAIDGWRDVLRELGRLGAELRETTGRTRRSAVTVSETCHAQANVVARVRAAVAEVAAGTERLAGDASATERHGEKALGAVASGVRAAREAVATLAPIAKSVDETARRIARVEATAAGIGDAVEPLDEVAEQAKFLALNTAIRASVGESGGGLRPLADDLQRLAEGIARAARQLRGHVGEVEAATAAAAASAGASASGVEDGARVAGEADRRLGEIEKACRDLRDRLAGASGRLRREAGEAEAATDMVRSLRDGTDQLHRESLETIADMARVLAAAHRLEQRVADLSPAPDQPVEPGQPAPSPPQTRDAEPEGPANVSPIRPPTVHAKTGS